MSNKHAVKIIALDFDGTIVTDKYPGVGEPIKKNIEKVRKEIADGAKVILWTNRCGMFLEAAIRFCVDHDIRLEAVNENLPEVIEEFGGDPRKIFANEYWDDRAVHMSEEEEKVCCEVHISTCKPSIFIRAVRHICRAFRLAFRAIKDIFRPRKGMTGWAYREVELACKNEREDSKVKDGDWDYGCACYESALRAFRSLTKAGHSGFSIGLTQNILNRLIDGRPLTPIVDTPEIWNDISNMSGLKGEEVNYQCKRMSSLFKYVYADGTVKYSDINSHYCIDISNKSTYHSGLVQKIIDEMYPITMPYWPTAPIKVYCQDLLTDRKNGDFDTVGIFYLIKPDGERVEINRFFKEGGKDWDEITAEEYEQRKKLELKRLWEEKTDVPSFMKKEFHIPNEVELQDIASKEFDRSNTPEEIAKRATNSCEAQEFKE